MDPANLLIQAILLLTLLAMGATLVYVTDVWTRRTPHLIFQGTRTRDARSLSIVNTGECPLRLGAMMWGGCIINSMRQTWLDGLSVHDKHLAPSICAAMRASCGLAGDVLEPGHSLPIYTLTVNEGNARLLDDFDAYFGNCVLSFYYESTFPLILSTFKAQIRLGLGPTPRDESSTAPMGTSESPIGPARNSSPAHAHDD